MSKESIDIKKKCFQDTLGFVGVKSSKIFANNFKKLKCFLIVYAKIYSYFLRKLCMTKNYSEWKNLRIFFLNLQLLLKFLTKVEGLHSNGDESRL